MVALRLAHLFHDIVDSNLATTIASIRVALTIGTENCQLESPGGTRYGVHELGMV